MSKFKKHSLTAENLQTLENQFADEDKREKDLSRKRIPKRTAGDGRSSSKHSHGSQLTAFKESLKKKNPQVEISQPRHSDENRQTKTQRSGQWFHRPEREPFRRNPEGRSRNPSVPVTPNVTRIDYNDDDDYRINYEDEDEQTGKGSANSPVEEESEDESSRISSDEVYDAKPREDVVSDDGTPLTRSSSPMLSEDNTEEEEEEGQEEEEEGEGDKDDTEEEEETEEEAIDSLDPDIREAIQNAVAQAESKPSTPASIRSSYSSTINGDTSSIPTAAASPISRTSSRQSKTTKNMAAYRAGSVASSAPSYVLNKHSYRLQKLRDKMEKERAMATSSKAESSIILSMQNSDSDLSMRERCTTTPSPSRGGSVIRNWSRWSQRSDAGYSISEGRADTKRIKKAQQQKTKGAPTPKIANSRTPSKARLSSALQISRIKSEPDVRKTAVKRQVTLTADPTLSRSRPTSRGNQASRTSIRSIMKPTSTSRVKSEPNLKKYASSHDKLKVRQTKSRPVTKKNEKLHRATRPITRNEARKTDENDLDDAYDFSNRKKKICKKKERPTRKGAESTLSNVSSTRTRQTKNKSFATNSRKSTSLSTRSSKSGLSNNESTRSRNNLTSASTVLSRKPFPPFLNDESGFYSDRGFVSSPGSLRVPETPFSSNGGRTTGMRSVITRYSSGPSRPPSSAKSSLFVSDESLSTQSDGESTALGPETTSPTIQTPVQEETKPTPTPAPTPAATPAATPAPSPAPSKSEKESDSDTEKFELPPIKPQPNQIISPYTSTVREPKKTKKQKEEKLPRIVRVNHPMPSLEAAKRDSGMTRLVKLSKPKESKAIWMTSFWPIVWGNQDMVWPMPPAAFSAKVSERLDALATPKKNFQLDHPLMCSREEFQRSCGRNSVIWKVSPLAMKCEASARVTQLSQPKKSPPEFEEHRQPKPLGDVTQRRLEP